MMNKEVIDVYHYRPNCQTYSEEERCPNCGESLVRITKYEDDETNRMLENFLAEDVELETVNGKSCRSNKNMNLFYLVMEFSFAFVSVVNMIVLPLSQRKLWAIVLLYVFFLIGLSFLYPLLKNAVLRKKV